MPLEIRRTTKPAELTAVFRQRYAVYAEELGYPQRYADHSARMVVEPLDNYGHILGAYDDGILVGSVRINYGSEIALGDYVDLYDMRRFAWYFPERLSICTKFIVARHRRSTMIMAQLSKACYEYRPVHQARNVFNLIDSKPPLDEYFRRLGYRQIRPPIVHPEAGAVVPLVLPISIAVISPASNHHLPTCCRACRTTRRCDGSTKRSPTIWLGTTPDSPARSTRAVTFCAGRTMQLTAPATARRSRFCLMPSAALLRNGPAPRGRGRGLGFGQRRRGLPSDARDCRLPPRELLSPDRL